MLRDYYKLCDKLNISVDKDTFFPKDLKKEHDRLVKEDRRREKERTEFLRGRLSKYEAVKFGDCEVFIDLKGGKI